MRVATVMAMSMLGGALLPSLTPRGTSSSPAPQAESAVTLSGLVYDSLAGAPLAGADVQLLGEGTTASHDVTTDSLGQFTVDRVEPGTYLVGFFHPRVDSLGVDIPPVRVRVADGEHPRVTLAVPSRRTIVTTFCPDSQVTPETTLLLGFVRDAGNGNPLGGASVSVFYSEVGFANGALTNMRRGGIVEGQADGRFAACNLPPDAELVVRAAAGADTSGALALRFPPNGILARDLYVASSGTGVGGASAPAAARRTVSTVKGRVMNSGGRPVPMAVVTVWGVTEAVQANENGDFTIAAVRGGSTTLDVTAPGHEAARIPIDVRTGEGQQNIVSVVLSRLGTTLNTVTVEASANPILIRNGFEERRGSGSGRFLDAKDLEKMRVITTTAAIARLPGTLLRTGTRGSRLFMRDTKGRACAPTIWVDGVQYNSAAESELDAVVDIDLLADPSHIAGVEVYQRLNQAPLRFAGTSRFGCGIIVIWRNDSARLPKKSK